MELRSKFIIPLIAILTLAACKNDPSKAREEPISPSKIPVYAWLGGPGNKTDAELSTEFKEFKARGIDVLM